MLHFCEAKTYINSGWRRTTLVGISVLHCCIFHLVPCEYKSEVIAPQKWNNVSNIILNYVIEIPICDIVASWFLHKVNLFLYSCSLVKENQQEFIASAVPRYIIYVVNTFQLYGYGVILNQSSMWIMWCINTSNMAYLHVNKAK